MKSQNRCGDSEMVYVEKKEEGTIYKKRGLKGKGSGKSI
jgi:hypothetical protein